MKKLLLGSAAILMGLAVTSPAQAGEGVKLDLGGHFKGYVSYLDQDERRDIDTDGAADDTRTFDVLRETEIHMSGETTLDNGLTVGAHFEMEADGSDTSGTTRDSFEVEESYVYFSGSWGRVNFGAEDGASYLLQVAAPSADSNFDGIRQYVNPVNYAVTDDAVVGVGAGISDLGDLSAAGLTRFDYDNNLSTKANKITYMTPVFNGFQGGISYTPELDDSGVVPDGSNALLGNSIDDLEDDYGDVWDVSARYEGQFDELGVTLGAGFSHAELEDNDALGAGGSSLLDDREQWNVGVDFDWGAFGLGVAYTEDDLGTTISGDQETLVVGADYTTGPYKLGVSYYTQDLNLAGAASLTGTPLFVGVNGIAAAATGDMETERWTAGVVYTYGPGMTFRGSVSFIENEMPTTADAADFEATTVLLGTQINF